MAPGRRSSDMEFVAWPSVSDATRTCKADDEASVG